MLSTILKSKVAVKVSVQIMNAFVTMRRFMLSNAQVFQRLDSLEIKQIATDKKIDEVFNAIESKTIQPKNNFFAMENLIYQFVPLPIICLNSIIEIIGRKRTILRIFLASTPVESLCEVVKIVGRILSFF